MAENRFNSKRYTLASPLAIGGTSFVLNEDAGSLPTSGLTRWTLSNAAGNQEIVTASGRSGQTLTGVLRGQESASDFPARAWNAGDFAEATLTTAGLQDALATTNPMTTQDDLIVGGASGARTRLAKGTDGQVLTVDPTSHHLGWATPSASGLVNPMTTSNDLIVGGTGGAPARLAKGSDGQVLSVDPATHALIWANNPAGFADPMSSKGDLIVRGATGTTRLAAGTNGQVLTADSAQALGVKWAAGGGVGGSTFTPPGSTTGWAWDVQGGSTLTANADAWDMTTDTADGNVHAYYRAYPTPPFSVVAGIKPPLMGVNYNGAGIGFAQGSGNMYLFYVGYQDSIWYISVDKWNAYNSFNSRPFRAGASLRDVLMFKIEDDNTNVKFSMAHDLAGNWQQVWQETRTTWVAAANRLHSFMQASTALAARSRLVHWVVA